MKRTMNHWRELVSTAALVFAMSLGASNAAAQITYTDDFEAGANASGWNFGGYEVSEAAGGNPGGWLKGEYTDSFTSPKARTTVGALTPFHGDYATAGVTSISVDVTHIANQYGMDLGGYGMTGALWLRDNDTGMTAVAPLNVAAMGIPDGTWTTVNIPVDSSSATIPANWNDAAGGLNWATLMQGVDQVELTWYDPDWISIGATYTVGIDNMTINYAFQVPTVSEWGLVIMALIGLVVGTRLFARHRLGAKALA